MSETDWSAGAAFVDDGFVPIEAARISVLDWGFTHSDVTYDVVHVWKGAFFRLEDHLDRFAASMRALRLETTYGRDDIRGILIECVRRSGLRDAYVAMVATRGRPRKAGTRRTHSNRMPRTSSRPYGVSSLRARMEAAKRSRWSSSRKKAPFQTCTTS